MEDAEARYLRTIGNPHGAGEIYKDPVREAEEVALRAMAQALGSGPITEISADVPPATGFVRPNIPPRQVDSGLRGEQRRSPGRQRPGGRKK